MGVKGVNLGYNRELGLNRISELDFDDLYCAAIFLR